LRYYDKQYKKGLENRMEPKPTIMMVFASLVNDWENAKFILNEYYGRD